MLQDKTAALLLFYLGAVNETRPHLSPLQRLGLGTASPCRLLAAYGSGVRVSMQAAQAACSCSKIKQQRCCCFILER